MLQTNVDFTTKKLRLPDTTINLKFKNLNKKATSDPHSDKIVQIKIDNEKDDTAIFPHQITPPLEIPECLVQVENHLASIIVYNPTDHNITLDQNNPFKVIPESQFYVPDKPPSSNNITTNRNRLDLSKIRLNHTNWKYKKKLPTNIVVKRRINHRKHVKIKTPSLFHSYGNSKPKSFS